MGGLAGSRLAPETCKQPERGIKMRKNKGLVLLALVALAAFMVTATVGGSASASGGHAVAAKKKCKKKKASSAKKKKCKKKGGDGQHAVGSRDADLVEWRCQRCRHGPLRVRREREPAGNGSDTIPQSTLSPDLTGPAGTETFTDLAFNQKRSLSFGVCYTVGGLGPHAVHDHLRHGRRGDSHRDQRRNPGWTRGHVQTTRRRRGTKRFRPRYRAPSWRASGSTYMRRVGSSYPPRRCGYRPCPWADRPAGPARRATTAPGRRRRRSSGSGRRSGC